MAKHAEHLKLPEVDYLSLHPPKHHLQTLRTAQWCPTEGWPNSRFSSEEVGKVVNLDFLSLISFYSFLTTWTIFCSA